MAPLDSYTASLPAVQDDAAQELLPSILADEIAFRSQLLARVRRCEQALLKAIDQGAYTTERCTLPQLATAFAKIVETTERILERSKHIDPGTASRKQVTGLIARHALLRRELEARGLMDEHGRLRMPSPAGVAVEVTASITDASAAPQPTGEGVSEPGASP